MEEPHTRQRAIATLAGEKHKDASRSAHPARFHTCVNRVGLFDEIDDPNGVSHIGDVPASRIETENDLPGLVLMLSQRPKELHIHLVGDLASPFELDSAVDNARVFEVPFSAHGSASRGAFMPDDLRCRRGSGA